MKNKKQLSGIIAAVLIIVAFVSARYDADTTTDTPSSSTVAQQNLDRDITQLYQSKQSDEFVTVSGEVVKLLADDNEGSRHQRFILRLDSGHSLLISHNIDLAPRINDLRESDRVSLRGEYEWNQKGGVVHWTHHDPRGRHDGGWIEHDGKRYR